MATPYNGSGVNTPSTVGALPTVTSDLPHDLRTFLNALVEVVNSGAGVQTKDLIDTGLFQEFNGDLTVDEDFSLIACQSPPPIARNLEASGAFETIVLEWEGIDYGASKCYAHTEIYRSGTDDLGTATLIGISSGRIYSDLVGPGNTLYYWVRIVDSRGARSGFNLTSGTVGVTAPDVDFIMDILTEEYGLQSSIPFFWVKDGETLAISDTVTLGPGIYIKTAFIGEATIVSAQIRDLNVDKLTTAEATIAKAIIGDGHVTNLMIDNVIQSNDDGLTWRIDKNGGAHFRELSVYDEDGTPLLTAGGAINISNIPGVGAFATLSQIDADNISTYLAGAAITDAYIGRTIQSADFGVDATGNYTGWQLDRGATADGDIAAIGSKLIIKNGEFYGTLKVTGDVESDSYLDMTNEAIKVMVDGVARVQIGNLDI